jgi:ATP-dependent Clp protease adaptor protein ClpS
LERMGSMGSAGARHDGERDVPPLRLKKTDPPRVGLDLDSLLRSDPSQVEKLEPPYRVLLHNDDVTPIDYVPRLLRRVFRVGRARAVWLTLRAHVQGSTVVVVEARRKAEAHVAEAHEMARQDGHVHLTLTLEPEDS